MLPVPPSSSNTAQDDKDFSRSSVPSAAQTQGLWAGLMVLVGFTFFTPSMTAGGTMGVSMSREDFFLALVLGNALLATYCGVLAHIGQKTGLGLDLLACRAFGVKGSWLPASFIVVTQVGWFGVGVAMFALPVASLFSLPVWPVVIVSGAVMTMTACLGIRALAVIGAAALPLVAGLSVYSVYWGISEAHGLAHVFSAAPSRLSAAVGISIVVGAFISGGTTTPNFTRFSRSPRVAVVASVVGFGLGNFLMFFSGAVGGAVTGKPDIFDILMLQGLTLPALIILGISIWTTNNTGLYSSGLSMAHMAQVPLRRCTLLAGLCGTAAALWLYHNFIIYLTLLSGIMPPVGMVIILHYYLDRDAYAADSPLVPLRIEAVAAVLAGIVIGSWLPGITAGNILLVATLSFVLADRWRHALRRGAA